MNPTGPNALTTHELTTILAFLTQNSRLLSGSIDRAEHDGLRPKAGVKMIVLSPVTPLETIIEAELALLRSKYGVEKITDAMRTNVTDALVHVTSTHDLATLMLQHDLPEILVIACGELSDSLVRRLDSYLQRIAGDTPDPRDRGRVYFCGTLADSSLLAARAHDRAAILRLRDRTRSRPPLSSAPSVGAAAGGE